MTNNPSNTPSPVNPSVPKIMNRLLVAVVTSPIALILAPFLLFSVAFHHYFVLAGIGKELGLNVTRKRVGPFLWPLAGTLGIGAISFVGHVVFSSLHAGPLGAILGATGFALVVGPLTFYIPAGLDENGAEGISAAMRHWDAVPRLDKLRLLGLRVFSVVLAMSGFLLITLLSEDKAVAVLVAAAVAVAGYALGLGLYQWALISTYMKVRLPEGTDTSLGENRRRLLLPLVMTLLLVVPIALLFAWTTVHTAPMALAHPGTAHVYGGRTEYSVPGTELTLTPGEDGVLVAMADGGGAGVVRYVLDCEPVPEDVEIGITTFAPHVDVYVLACGQWQVISLSDQGVRRDDGFRDRVVRGLGTPVLSTFLLALLVFGLAAWRLVPSLAAARRIHAVVRAEDLESGDQQSVLVGRLTLAGARMKRRRLIGEGALEIRLGLDLFRMPLPKEGVLCSEGEFRDGTKICLVGQFPSMARGHRDASIPWPSDAFLVEGDVETARERWLWSATRNTRLTAAAANLLLIACYGLLALHIT